MFLLKVSFYFGWRVVSECSWIRPTLLLFCRL